MIYDVIVAGAGPCGSAAAELCAQHGLRTLCIEEHGTIGYPVQCAGLLSTAAFSECRVSERPVLNRVSGARINAGAGNEVRIDARTTKAFVVDRGMLDREMAQAAADAGAEFRLRTSVTGIRGNRVLTRGIGGPAELEYRILIAADGPRSTIARCLRMQRAPVYLAGIQADMKSDCDPAFVEVYPDAAPDFFGWSIPIAPGRVRVGLCSATNVPERFQAFQQRFGATTTHLVTGTLPLGVMPKTCTERTLFVGDAAGFAKPTSGGGIYTGVRSARHAAAVACEACSSDTYTDAFLSRYEQRWQEDFGRELMLGFQLFSLRQRLSGTDMDDLVRALNDPEIIRTIEEHGDMDRPGNLVKKLVMKPAVLKMIRPLVRSGLRSIL